jgi:hypothetical protein
MIASIEQFCKKFPTRPALQDLLIECLRQWLAGNPIQSQDYPWQYQSLIDNQQATGLIQLLMGRFVKEWAILEDEYLKTVHRKPYHSGKTWVTGMIAVIWSHIYENWTDRNNDRHGHDISTQDAHRIDQARRETIELYSSREMVPLDIQDIFYSSLEEHFEIEQTAIGLRQWINTWGPIIRRHSQHTNTDSPIHH